MRISDLSGFEWAVFKGIVKEPKSIEVFRSLVRPGMVVFDLGAHVGYYALTAASLLKDSGEVHAFEPTANLAERIRLNSDLNGFSNVTVTQNAVSDSTGVATFHLSSEDPEANSLYFDGATERSISVPTVSLDHYIEKKEIKRVDIVKIDCEGAESKILMGAKKLLKLADAPIILLEVNPRALQTGGTSSDEIVHFLSSNGYGCFDLEALVKGVDGTHNMLAFKPAIAERFPELKLVIQKYPSTTLAD
jgi:FkbM family methyltransferase